MTSCAETKCPDCLRCQECAPSRCRKCRGGEHRPPGRLGGAFTHGRYLAWKEEQGDRKAEEVSPTAGSNLVRRPVVDLACCRGCDVCREACPEVFHRNEETGLMEVAELEAYPEERVEEAMRFCPEDCICWEEGPP